MPKGILTRFYILYKLKQLVLLLLCFVMCRCAFFVLHTCPCTCLVLMECLAELADQVNSSNQDSSQRWAVKLIFDSQAILGSALTKGVEDKRYRVTGARERKLINQRSRSGEVGCLCQYFIQHRSPHEHLDSCIDSSPRL